MSLLVTGFGPFLDVSDNPSAQLAERAPSAHQIIEVSFRAVDDFLDQLAVRPPTELLSIGVATSASQLRFETVAHNRIGPTPDVLGEVWGPGPIDPAGPPMRAGTLWMPEWLEESELSIPSTDAGGYLCNYLYFQALTRLPHTRVGFLHVPPPERVELSIQEDFVAALCQAISQESEGMS